MVSSNFSLISGSSSTASINRIESVEFSETIQPFCVTISLSLLDCLEGAGTGYSVG